MSRVAKKPITMPKGVEFKSTDDQVSVKGPKGTLSFTKPKGVEFKLEDGMLQLSAADAANLPMAGTSRAILANMIQGVAEGFTRKLELVGVGYRAAMQGKDLSLSLGFSHPTVYVAPEGITLATPTQTEILVSGADKQLVGEVAAKIRAYRKPEPYKGKGIRYSGEKINMKEAKKA
jgi:large subunit ribosomal protein L6